MAFHAACFDGKLGYQGIDDRQPISALLGGIGAAGVTGVFTSTYSIATPLPSYTGLQCSAGSGMTTSVAAGGASVANTFQATQGGVWVVRNDGAVATSSHAPNTSGFSRWDCVGVRVYDSDSGGDSSDVTTPLVITGTPSGSASFSFGSSRFNQITSNLTGAPGQSGGPTFQRNFLPLALVLVPDGAGSSSVFSYFDYRSFITGGKQDSGWQPLTLISGVTTQSDGTHTAVCRLLGEQVWFGGAFYLFASFPAGGTLATMPVGIPSPATTMPCMVLDTNGSGVVGSALLPFKIVNGTPGAIAASDAVGASSGFGYRLTGLNYWTYGY